ARRQTERAAELPQAVRADTQRQAAGREALALTVVQREQIFLPEMNAVRAELERELPVVVDEQARASVATGGNAVLQFLAQSGMPSGAGLRRRLDAQLQRA